MFLGCIKDMKENFSESFFRGIIPSYYQNGFLVPEAFHLDPVREDGFSEISITWNDDSEAFNVIASQRKEETGEIQFSAGISEIDRKEFEHYMKPQILANNVKYERKPTNSNRYHGNILVNNSLEKHIKNMIKGQLALLAQECIHPNPFVS